MRYPSAGSRGQRLQHATSMGSSGLLLMAWACGLAAVGATGSSVEPLGAPDECARCFAENERFTSRIEQLLMRVDQLEAELARGDGQGAREGLVRGTRREGLARCLRSQ